MKLKPLHKFCLVLIVLQGFTFGCRQALDQDVPGSTTDGVTELPQEGRERDKVNFVELISLGQDKVCAYTGSYALSRHKRLMKMHDDRLTFNKRQLIAERWLNIKSSESVKVYGPMNPVELIGDIFEQRVPANREKLMVPAIGVTGLALVLAGLPLQVINSGLDARVKMGIGGAQQGGDTLLDVWRTRGLSVDWADGINLDKIWKSLKRTPLVLWTRAQLNITESQWNVIFNRRFWEVNVPLKIIESGGRITWFGFGLLTVSSLYFLKPSNPMFSEHEVRSIFSNSQHDEQEAATYERLLQLVDKMPEDLTTECPTPEEVVEAFKQGDYSYYNFELSKFPENRVKLSDILHGIQTIIFNVPL